NGWARYALEPVTGKRHQLRVHMAALGLPLRNDAFYPEVNDPPEGDYSRPLQLLARSLEFIDPLTGALRCFESQRQLEAL
ncbi:MAG: pseudouridine synthase, partial [Giesbergeria sp.]